MNKKKIIFHNDKHGGEYHYADKKLLTKKNYNIILQADKIIKSYFAGLESVSISHFISDYKINNVLTPFHKRSFGRSSLKKRPQNKYKNC